MSPLLDRIPLRKEIDRTNNTITLYGSSSGFRVEDELQDEIEVLIRKEIEGMDEDDE